MQATTMQPTTAPESDPVLRWTERRAQRDVNHDRCATNRANSQNSTGPRTETGKQRSSLNALTHGLTARTAVLPSEDHSAYEKHCRAFQDEYQPATPTETQLVQELADTSWRLNRIPLLEAGLFRQTRRWPPDDVIDALAKLGLHSARLSRQFQRTLNQLRALQSERRDHESRRLPEAAELVEHHKKQTTLLNSARDGFVFSRDQIQHPADLLASLPVRPGENASEWIKRVCQSHRPLSWKDLTHRTSLFR